MIWLGGATTVLPPILMFAPMPCDAAGGAAAIAVSNEKETTCCSIPRTPSDMQFIEVETARPVTSPQTDMGEEGLEPPTSCV